VEGKKTTTTRKRYKTDEGRSQPRGSGKTEDGGLKNLPLGKLKGGRGPHNSKQT